MIGSRPPLSSVLFQPINTPFAYGTNVVLDVQRRVNLINGCLASSNFVGGLYVASFGGYSRDIKVLIPINDTNTYTFQYCALLATNVVYWAGTSTQIVNQVISNALASLLDATLTTNLPVAIIDHTNGWGSYITFFDESGKGAGWAASNVWVRGRAEHFHTNG